MRVSARPQDCSGECADLTSDAKHCGDCGTACEGDKICVTSDCTCPAGEMDCGSGTCANLSNDKDHCGDCDTACPNNQICKSKSCGCAAGQSECDDSCFDLDTDHDHCGNCGTACNSAQVCSGGTCLLSPCDKLCNPSESVALGDDGFRVEPLGSGNRCLEVKGYEPTATSARIVCWNLDGSRTLRVNGSKVACLTGDGVPLGDERAGGYCVQVSAGPNPNNAGLILPTK